MVLGDFNLDRIGDPLYEAFTAAGVWPPTELNQVLLPTIAVADDYGINPVEPCPSQRSCACWRHHPTIASIAA
jgi:hypothetical protein